MTASGQQALHHISKTDIKQSEVRVFQSVM